MKVSFVILNYNRKNELLTTLTNTKNLHSNPDDYEIVVVDNNSADGSALAVKENFPDVTVVARTDNNGIAGWNYGFEKAKGDYFVVLDDDSHVESGLEEAVKYMDNNPDVGILALNVKTGPYTPAIWGWKDGDDLIGFIGCGAIIKKDLYDKIGGFGSWLFVYAHEWEYGLRCLDAGYKIRFFENCYVNHRTSAVNRTSKRLRVFSTRNELAIVYKHFSVNRLRYLFRVAFNHLKIIKHGEWSGAWYNLTGIYQFLKMRKTLQYSPVSAASQAVFVKKFDTTKKSVFGFVGEKAVAFFKSSKS